MSRWLRGLLLGSVMYAVMVSALPVVNAQDVSSQFEQQDAIDFYQERYRLSDAYVKWIDNQGNGYEPLYGLRNMRMVLNGLVYRGGANNAYFKYGKRDNMNPLPDLGLKNLCQEGFTKAVYLYPTNYSTAPKQTTCQGLDQQNNLLDYAQLSPFSSANVQIVLQMVFERIQQPEVGPIYLHCWNGWHASGLISAYILRQFCGVSADQAVSYWDQNTDGNNQGAAYEGHRTMIRQFVANPKWKIDSTMQARICPKL